MNGTIFAIPRELVKTSDIHTEKANIYREGMNSTQTIINEILTTVVPLEINGDYVNLMKCESDTLSGAVSKQIISKYTMTGCLLESTAKERSEIDAEAEKKAKNGVINHGLHYPAGNFIEKNSYWIDPDNGYSDSYDALKTLE